MGAVSRNAPATVFTLGGVCRPAQAFERLYGGDDRAFLYESLERKGGRGRYSFFGGRPSRSIQVRGESVEIEDEHGRTQRNGPLREVLRGILRELPPVPPVAPFPGGLVGYFAYDVVRRFERLPERHAADPAEPDAWLLVPQEIVVCDHVEQRTHLILSNHSAEPRRVAEVRSAVLECSADPESRTEPDDDGGVEAMPSNMTEREYCAAIERAQEHVRAGDIFQTVLSQCFRFDWPHAAMPLYESLRRTNPSPYMYFLRLDDLHILGSSPEVLVRLEGRNVMIRPLAGTRPRGATPSDDAALEADLKSDPKERAEHIMLVDLARNDIGRVCRPGSVRVVGLLETERFSRVMHLVSQVTGELDPRCDALDLLEATFPAGTVSGAPKIRAMEIIDELEPSRRGVYAGAIGYLSRSGDMDLCIAIRTIVLRCGVGRIQAGAGVVADSVPRREYEETLNKARGLMRAVTEACRRLGGDAM